ncbi:MAG TPA: low affinity iron permease family protein, partial [Vicinamibacteria bacterium]
MRDAFRKFAHKTSEATGSPWAFMLAVLALVVWAVSGPLFHFSETWQLVINTGTTIVTFLMVFLIQNTQNRDAKAIHLKLDELLKGVEGARTGLVDLEEMTDA